MGPPSSRERRPQSTSPVLKPTRTAGLPGQLPRPRRAPGAAGLRAEVKDRGQESWDSVPPATQQPQDP